MTKGILTTALLAVARHATAPPLEVATSISLTRTDIKTGKIEVLTERYQGQALPGA